MNPSADNEPYNKSGSFVFQKSGVFYFVRRVPTDLARHHTTPHGASRSRCAPGRRQPQSDKPKKSLPNLIVSGAI